MNSTITQRAPSSASEWLLVAYVAALPLMKPAIAYPIVLPDLIFVLLAVSLATEFALRRRRFEWQAAFAVLALYVLSVLPSLLATPNLPQSAYKLATQIYLIGLAAAAMLLVRTELMLRRIVLAWLAATAVLAALTIASLTAFLVDPDGALYAYSVYHFGTLPPGHYPRLSLTFFNANMLANYLSVSLALALLAWHRGWIGGTASTLLLTGIAVALATTVSPGIGGAALLLALWSWVLWQPGHFRLARPLAIAGGVAAALFVVALAVTPLLHPTAPFVLDVAGIRLAPSGRFLTWSAAVTEFNSHPLAGHGLGIDAVDVRYLSPSGHLQRLTDAHSTFLSIAAQCGLFGLAGLAALIAYTVRLSRPWRRASPEFDVIRFALGTAFVGGFVYQGLGGSFEDTRHLWFLFGLLVAAARLPVSRPDGRNRKAGAPSPC